jgi:transposase-like protein
MSLARVVVTSVLVEGRSKAAVARDYGLSRRWVHELVRRFEADGEAGLEPRSHHIVGAKGFEPLTSSASSMAELLPKSLVRGSHALKPGSPRSPEFPPFH